MGQVIDNKQCTERLIVKSSEKNRKKVIYQVDGQGN